MIALPPCDYDDIQWACRVLGLPLTAFTGLDGSDPRAAALLSNESLDIEACPGSGKTTLLVAKLAILARRWKAIGSGICVLSHTNAARREIERCLGRTAEGGKLLSYPHYIGTIHGFVNEFLAIPWLRSLGYPIVAIDDSQCEQHRRKLLRQERFTTLRNHVTYQETPANANYVGKWQVSSPDFLVFNDTGNPLFMNNDSPSARQLAALTRRCAEDGYYRFEEMFMWAEDLLNKHPHVISTIRQRFPLLFIDEVQDNSEPQSRILKRIFIEGIDPVIRQRFGDSNQAIYSHGMAKGAESDEFPIEAICHNIPNSHRFGQEIADLANPLAMRPQNVQGLGPTMRDIRSDTSNRHAILLFDDASVTSVLDCYGSYLLELFTEDELKVGSFCTVGAVHKPGDDSQLPRFVGHYWAEYDHELSSSEPKPTTFLQFIAAGWNQSVNICEVFPIVEQVAAGVLRALQIAGPTVIFSQRKRKHQYVLELLNQEAELKARYIALILDLVNRGTEVGADDWEKKWLPVILQIVTAIIPPGFNPIELDNFLAFPPEKLERREQDMLSQRRDNFYKYPQHDPKVKIRVGSIHSVKGETHTATLVLDTYYFLITTQTKPAFSNLSGIGGVLSET